MTFLLFTIHTLLSGNQSQPPHVVDKENYVLCGVNCLYVVTHIRGLQVDFETTKQAIGPPSADHSHSFADLLRAADSIGMRAVGIQASRSALSQLPMPCIIQVTDYTAPGSLPHFVVLLRADKDGVWLTDPPVTAYFLPDERFLKTWTGYVLVFPPDESTATAIIGLADYDQAKARAAWIWVALSLILGLAVTFGIWKRFVKSILPLFRLHPVRSMGSIVTVPVAVVFVYVAYCTYANGRIARPARCIFEPAVRNLGNLATGEHKTKIIVHNPGREPLQISKATSNCTCAAASIPGTINPGASAEVEVSFNVAPGPRSAQVTIESNDPDGPKHAVLYWQGDSPPILIPDYLFVSAVPADKVFEQTVKLLFPGGKSALIPELVKVECESPHVEITVGTANPIAKQYARLGVVTKILGERELRVSVRPPEGGGRVKTQAILHSRCGTNEFRTDLPINLHFYGNDLIPEVSGVTFAGRAGSDLVGQERVVRVRYRNQGDSMVVANAPAWLSCQVVTGSDDADQLIIRVVTIPNDWAAPSKVQIARAADSSKTVPIEVFAFTTRSK